MDGLATARTTRGKKIKLPAGEGGGPEDDFDDEDEDFEDDEEAGEANYSEDDGGVSARAGEPSAGASGAPSHHERMDVDP